MELTQFIDGYTPALLRNTLFCYRNNVDMYDYPIPDNVRIINIKTDARSILRIEEMLSKPFEKITLKDILLYPNTIKTTRFIKNIYFRYFNMNLVNEIYYWANKSTKEIMENFGCTRTKAAGMTYFNFDESKYIKKYNPDKITIYTSKNSVDTHPERSLDFNIDCIKILNTSDDPLKDLEIFYAKNKVKFTRPTIRKIKKAIKRKRFYENYINEINSFIRTGKITYRNKKYSFTAAADEFVYMYYLLRLAYRNDIPGRKWDKKIGVVKVNE